MPENTGFIFKQIEHMVTIAFCSLKKIVLTYAGLAINF